MVQNQRPWNSEKRSIQNGRDRAAPPPRGHAVEISASLARLWRKLRAAVCHLAVVVGAQGFHRIPLWKPYIYCLDIYE